MADVKGLFSSNGNSVSYFFSLYFSFAPVLDGCYSRSTAYLATYVSLKISTELFSPFLQLVTARSFVADPTKLGDRRAQ